MENTNAVTLDEVVKWAGNDTKLDLIVVVLAIANGTYLAPQLKTDIKATNDVL